jgi:flagellum-specific peptidoglycan hydrolase FlgJ
VQAVRKPWWQQATALVAVSTGGVITGFNFVPGTAATMTSPTAVPLHLLALEQAAQPSLAAQAPPSDAQLRAAIVNVATHYLHLAATRTPAQMEALIWDKVSTDSTDHGESCAAFASLTLELAAQATGQQSWVTGGTTYPWPLNNWADPRVDTNPDSPAITSLVGDAQTHQRWHPLGDSYQPQPGDWAVFDEHVEVITSYSGDVLHTIGADSLPGLTVNAHTLTGPLGDQGVAGFIDNGNLQATGATNSGGSGSSSGGGSGNGSSSGGSAAAAGGDGSAAGKSTGGTKGSKRAVAAAGGGSATARTAPAAAVPGVLAASDALGAESASGPASSGSGAAAGGDSKRGSAAAASVPGLLDVSASTMSGTPAAGIPASSAAAPPKKRAAAKPATPKPATPKPATPKPASAPAAAPSTSAGAAGRDQQAFISLVAPGAIAAQQRYGVPAAVTIAQAIEESAWGQSGLAADYHNLFGIKGTGPAGSVAMPTSEYSGGEWVSISAQFRAYHNDAESIADHAELLATSGYYTRAMADKAVPDAFANDLTGVYATDPDYGANLIALMKLYNLYRFDAAGSSAAGSSAAGSSAATPAAKAAVTPAATAPEVKATTASGRGTSGPRAAVSPAAPSASAASVRARGSRALVPGVAAPSLVPAGPSAAVQRGEPATSRPAGARLPGPVTPGRSSTAVTTAVTTAAVRRGSGTTPANSGNRAAGPHSVDARLTSAQATGTQVSGARVTGAGVPGGRAAGTPGSAGRGNARASGAGAPGPVVTTAAIRYQRPLPASVTSAFFGTAKAPLARGEHLYRDVAASQGLSWQLLAAVDWLECKADPRRSPAHGEKLGTVNPDGTCYATKSQALAQCACDLIELASVVYGIDLTARRRQSVRALAAAFAAFRWGAILRRHGVSAMEFPYAVAGLTEAHQKMHWPGIDAPDAPDKPGGRFREPFGAVPVVLSLGYPATV